MPFQAVNDTWQIQLEYGVAGGPAIINTFYGRDQIGNRGTAEAQELAENFVAWHFDHVKALQPSGLLLRSVRVKDIDTRFGARYEATPNQAGALATAPAPGAIAAIVKMTGNPGNPPREALLFHPGVTEAQVSEAGLDVTYATDLAAAYTDLISQINENGVPGMALVLLSRYEGFTIAARANGTSFKKPTPRNPAVTNTIAAITVGTKYGVQKRRRPSPL